jgi:hypothetical protein
MRNRGSSDPRPVVQTQAAGSSTNPRRNEGTDENSSMVVLNPAPDASPSRAPSQSRTFTVSS